MKKHLISIAALALAAQVEAQSLSTALDGPGLNWTTGGNAVWLGETAVTHDTVDAAQSGTNVFYGFESWLQTSITGPGLLSFWWKLASDVTCGSTLRIEMGGANLDYLYGPV